MIRGQYVEINIHAIRNHMEQYTKFTMQNYTVIGGRFSIQNSISLYKIQYTKFIGSKILMAIKRDPQAVRCDNNGFIKL